MKKSTPPAIAAIDRATSAYLEEIARIHRRGETKELTYRSALETLLRAHLQKRMPQCEVIHEPAKQKCGAPDFAVKKSGVAFGFVETKKIGADLNAVEKSEQIARYRAALPNLLLSDYLEFRLYAEGTPDPVAVAKIADSAFHKKRSGADNLAKLLGKFADAGEIGPGESPDAARLAKIMAGKTRLLRDLAEKTAADPNSELAGIYQGLRAYLIRDLALPDFADIFAQTAAYGLFAARLESERKNMPTFSRVQAGELLPQTTPFLRRFFNAFAGADMDERISWMADDIAEMFSAVSLDNVVRAFNLGGGQADDPFLHFYETFLREYDSKKKAALGVYFTPLPVVDFIVRAVDHSLVHDFKIPNGLANESTAKFQGRKMHKVQILDPAAGTGAFLARVAELVRKRVEESAGKGGWKNYAPEHLLPRLHGFEIMMSAYAMCHLKMALTLGDSVGGLFQKARGHRDFRVNVFLASALDAPKSEAGNPMFLQWLRNESDAADRVKTQTPVMVVLGNPPYNVSSQNRGEWISVKLDDYKRGLNERHSNLDDDYVKFIRCAEHFIEQNERGVVAMITNNSFLDGVTHRKMREHLLGTFDSIRILNLHGNAKIHERAPDGGPDQNVFNIMQGVGIFIMAKTRKKAKGKNARVFHAKLQGKRKMKYEFLARESVDSVKWRELRPAQPHYFFTPKNFSAEKKYMRGVGVKELLRQNRSGSKTDRDSLFIDMDKKPLAERMRTLLGRNFGDDFSERHKVQNSTGYKILEKIRDAKKAGGFKPGFVLPILYRPFDERLVYYDPELLSRPNNDTMRHMKGGENVALLTTRLIPANHNFTHAHVSRRIVDIHAGGGQTYVFPLWVWEGEVGKRAIRRANFRGEVAEEFAKRMGMKYSEEGKGSGVVSPESLFDYIYAVLHRPSYRRDFAEFLRVDFPRIPAATDKREFRRMSKLGRELRELHLLESSFLDGAGHPFSADGENKVDKIRFAPDSSSGGARGRVYINANRYFANVPLAAWEYCVGGYYPAQKWLKDRKGRSLNFDDQRHYRRMLSALARTAELVEKLDGK